jgi:epoxide hydrolase 4
MNYEYIETNGIRLHVAQAGSEENPLVILLHGFPEFSYGWRKQIPYLVEAGYRVWVPDQRGYNLSDKPDGLAAYSLDELAADVIGLIDAAGEEKAFLVGHDWGASVAWWVAQKYPGSLEKLVIMNVPHGSVMMENLRSSFAQLRKSWYIFFFQIPWLPEFLVKMKNWKMGTASLTRTSRKGTFSENDLVQYRKAWSQPKAIKSMINWYRAVIQKPPKSSGSSRITVPTLVIWGAKDKFLGKEMAKQSIDLCDDGQLVFIEEATHWVQHEEAERVNELVDRFFKE